LVKTASPIRQSIFCRIKSTAKGKENETPLINAFSMQTMSNDCPDRKIARNNSSNNCAKLKLLLCPSSVLALLLIALCEVSLGQDYDIEVPGQPPSIPIPKGVTLFQNVRIFDGTRPTLSAPSNVLIRGNTIERISASPITVDANANVQVIAGKIDVDSSGSIGMCVTGWVVSDPPCIFAWRLGAWFVPSRKRSLHRRP